MIWISLVTAALPLLSGSPSPAPAAAGPEIALRACEFPIRWRIAEVDPRFGITEDEAAGAVRQAGMLWEAAVDQVLMFQQSAEGIPVSFVYDERQEATIERQRQLAQLEESAQAVEAAEGELRSLRSLLASRQRVHEARLVNYERRLESHRELVEFWNQRGGAPATEVQRVLAAEAEVEEARALANEAAAEVNELVAQANGLTDTVNDRITEINAARVDLESRFPPLTVQSGQYLEDRRGLGRITLSRDVEIHIFQFEDRDHLLQVIAHELGHAMGLEHSGTEGSLMAEAIVAAPGGGEPEVTEADADHLRAVCPDF